MASLGIAGQVVVGLALVATFLLSGLAGADTFSLLTEVPFAAVGAVLVIRRPGNSIGWLLLVVAALGVVSAVPVAGPAGPLLAGTAPLAERVLAWLTAVSGVPIFFCYALLALVFPSGRLPGGLWGRVLRGLIAIDVFLLLASAFAPTVAASGPGGSTIEAANPFALLPTGWWWDALNAAGPIVILGSPLIAVVSFVVRLRAARGLERQQMRWVVASLVVSCIAVAVALLTGAWGVAFLAFATIPVAIGIAVLRYHLYEIDWLISRTIAYGVLTVIIGGLFAGLVLAFQAVLAPVTQSNELAVAGSTLAVAALFQPLRNRVQGLVDRRFNRARVDAARTVAAFGGRLRDEVDLDQLGAEVIATIEGPVQPVSVSLWLRA